MKADDSTRRSGTIVHRRTALIGVIAYAAIVVVALWWFEGVPTAARIPLAVPLFIFAPGYAVITALFPRSETTAPLSTMERGVLAVVASVAVVPIVAFVTTVIVGLGFDEVLVGIAAVTAVTGGIGIVRDSLNDAATHRSYSVSEPFDWGTITDGVTLLAITLVAVLLVASAAVAYTGSGEDELLTEFYLVDETGPTGDGANADDGQFAYDLQIEHHGADPQRYTVVVSLRGTDTSTGDQAGTEIERSSTVVAPDETASVTATVPESELEAGATVRFLLYTESAPSSPNPETAHRALEISIDEPE